MPNHFHLLLITGEKPVSRLMQSLLTSYAAYYNKRHSRTGKLYENRYKSILCDRNSYFLELVRYIHLNPLRAHIVKDMKSLSAYKWTSHSVIMDSEDIDWLDASAVLSMFAETDSTARRSYEQFIAEGFNQPDNQDLEGGGLIRSAGGRWQAKETLSNREGLLGDERILGDSGFVEKALKRAGESEEKTSALRRSGFNMDSVIARAAEVTLINPGDLRTNSKKRDVTKARALACKWLVRDLGFSNREVSAELRIRAEVVSRSVHRGEDLEQQLGVRLTK